MRTIACVLLCLLPMALNGEASSRPPDHSMSLMPSLDSPCSVEDASLAFKKLLAPALQLASDRDYGAARRLLDQAGVRKRTAYESWLLGVVEWNLVHRTGDASHLAAIWEPLLPICYTPERAAEMRTIVASPTNYP
jgi:hypothetical protein